jgi:N-methylhydantoinase A
MLWVAIDVGGTFTDVVVYDREQGLLRSGKTPSTPEDTASGVINALTAMDVPLPQVERFRHGATVATNAALERAGARLGVVTTSGHRDVLIVGRGHRSRLYDIKAVREPGLVRRSQVLEVPERVDEHGAVITPLDEDAVHAAAARLGALQAESVAVCFLHAYANPDHEQHAARILREALPGIPVCCSSDVLPEQREYGRFTTTALNAYVLPVMASYLARLRQRLRDGGLAVAPEIMTSSGGSWTFERMAGLPVNSMLSGPAGGVIGAVEFAATLGMPDIITYDMGGTSTDVCLVRNGRYDLAPEGSVGGFPNRAPQIEINTVGAGGGSLAYLGNGGFLNVGPRSAGAVPGPACYGRGGTEPTVTDANVALGRFRPDAPLGGEIEVDVGAAQGAVGRLAQALSLAPDATAEGILRIAVTRMTGAIKEISVMRGIDPRDFTLFAFGGAGPLHAADIAAELGIREVVIPPLPGAFSAYGLLVAQRRCDASITRVMSMDTATLEDVQAVLDPLREAVTAELAAEGFGADRIRCEAAVDMRFAGQAFELTTPMPEAARSIDDLLAAFQRVYEERYAHADSGSIEAVSFRVAAYGLGEKPQTPASPVGGELEDARIGTRPVVFGGETLDTPVYRRDAIPDGAAVAGPAIIDEPGSATSVSPGFQALRHASGALILRQEKRS